MKKIVWKKVTYSRNFLLFVEINRQEGGKSMDKKEMLEIWLRRTEESLEKHKSELVEIKSNKETTISRFKFYIELLDEWLADESVSDDVKKDLADMKMHLNREINEGIEKEIKKLDAWVKTDEFIKEKVEQLIKQ